jgi:excisionase family DNA binding protein
MKEENQQDARLYSTADIARMLCVDASTVKRWADSGKIECYRTIGRHRRFSLRQVREFVANYHLEGIASRFSPVDFTAGGNRQ